MPLPTLANLHFSKEGLGWLRGTAAPSITIIAIMVGLGHSLLAMSGEESLAQVNREIAHPKLKNLERAGFVIFIYSMLFTSLVSFFAVMIIPDAARQKFLDNLIGGLSMFLVGPMSVRLLFHGFVVLVGTSDSIRRGEYGHHRLQRRAQPRGRGRRAPGLVPPSPPQIRHQLAPHQPDRHPATDHYRHQPRRCLHAG